MESFGTRQQNSNYLYFYWCYDIEIISELRCRNISVLTFVKDNQPN